MVAMLTMVLLLARRAATCGGWLRGSSCQLDGVGLRVVEGPPFTL